MKGSIGKVTYPGRKQVFRYVDKQGQWQCDRLDLMPTVPLDNVSTVTASNPIPLLQPVIKNGQRLTPAEPLEVIAQRTRSSVAQLPQTLRQLNDPVPPPPMISDALQALTDQTRKRIQEMIGR